MSVEWDIPVGTITTRRAVASKFGGALYGGIEPSTTTPNVLLYSDPEAGERNGYRFDGWDPLDPGVFYFTGFGRKGDQLLTSRNRTLAEHAHTDRALRVFQAPTGQRGEKNHEYLGEFRVDPESPYRREDAPGADSSGDRSVIVFRLLPVGRTARGSWPPAPSPAVTPIVEDVPPEGKGMSKVGKPSRPATIAELKEAALVERFETHLRKLAHVPRRKKIRPPNHARWIWSDTFDRTSNTLYEAKGVTTRENVRMAIGQLLDYRRFIVPSPTCAVLLPVRPPQDLVDLIHSCGFTLVYEDGKTFTTESPAPA